MFEKNKENLVIVYDDRSKEMASYMMQLISSLNSKDIFFDTPITAAMWTCKEYKNNLAKLTSNNRVVILGDEKLVSEHLEYSSEYRNDDFGMRYSWLGSICSMNVCPRSYNSKEYKKFVEFAEKEKTNINHLCENFDIFETFLEIIHSLCRFVNIFDFGNINKGFWGKYFGRIRQYYVERQKVLAAHFIFNDLKKFMEG